MTYEEAGLILLDEAKPRHIKWHKSMSGRTTYFSRSIVTPYPKTAISFEVFAHEIGHLLNNPDHKAPSWKRELQASEFALAQFERFGLKLPRKVKAKVYWYITYSVCQALNRGMKKVPSEAKKYTRGRIKEVQRTRSIVSGSLAEGNRTIRRVPAGKRYYADLKGTR